MKELYIHRLKAQQFSNEFEGAETAIELFKEMIFKKFDELPVIKHPYYQKQKQFNLEQIEAGKVLYMIRVYKMDPKQRNESYEIQCRLPNLWLNINLDFMPHSETKTTLYNATQTFRKVFFEKIKLRKKAASN